MACSRWTPTRSTLIDRTSTLDLMRAFNRERPTPSAYAPSERAVASAVRHGKPAARLPCGGKARNLRARRAAGGYRRPHEGSYAAAVALWCGATRGERDKTTPSRPRSLPAGRWIPGGDMTAIGTGQRTESRCGCNRRYNRQKRPPGLFPDPSRISAEAALRPGGPRRAVGSIPVSRTSGDRFRAVATGAVLIVAVSPDPRRRRLDVIDGTAIWVFIQLLLADVRLGDQPCAIWVVVALHVARRRRRRLPRRPQSKRAPWWH